MMKKTIFLLSFIFILFLLPLEIKIPIVLGSREVDQMNGIKIIDANPPNDHSVQFIANIVYSKIGKRELKVHLLVPTHKKRPMPLILYIKGSSWGKDKPQDTFRNIPQLVQFAKSGYIVASVEHRTSHEAKFPAQIHDVKAAVRFLRQNAKQYNIDVNRVGAWGTSSGGHLAALLGTSGGVTELEGEEMTNSPYSSRIQAVVDWYGPTDFLQISQHTREYDADQADSAESLLIGAPIQKNREKVKKANPITYISSDDPPFLIMHGDKDKRVPFNQSVLLYEALKREQIEVTLYQIRGAGHGNRFSKHEVLNTVQAFFDQHLKK